jgi:hypothetical protein
MIKQFRYNSNPFAFHRCWEVKADGLSNTEPEHFQDAKIQRLMDEKFQSLENQFAAIATLLQNQNKKQVKHKGKGKKSKNTMQNETEPMQSTSRETRSNQSKASNVSNSSPLTKEAVSRLNRFIGNQETPTQPGLMGELNSDIFTEDLQQESLKKIWIQKIDCQFNGNSIDSIEDNATEDQAMQQFWRMYYFNGQINSLFSSGLTYNDFLKGYFFSVFDLSTSNKAGSSFLVPAIRVGHLRMRYIISIIIIVLFLKILQALNQIKLICNCKRMQLFD